MADLINPVYEKMQRTVYGVYLQTCQLLGKIPDIKPNTTLNQRLNIHPNEVFSQTDFPTMKYFGIGNNGVTYHIDGNGEIEFREAFHIARDSGLFRPLPLLMREIGNDISAVERLRYRGRRIEEHGGRRYVAYYLMVIDYGNTIPQMEYNSVDADNNITTSSFVPTLEDLNPTHHTPNSNGVLATSGDFLNVSAKFDVVLDMVALSEIMNCATIIYGDPKKAIISEYATFYGVDRLLPGEFNGTMLNYTEVVGATIHSFGTGNYALKYFNRNLTLSLDAGCVEPLYDPSLIA